jgi:hypothetical protein
LEYRRVGAIVIRLAYGDSVYQEHGKALVDLNHETLDLVTATGTQFFLVNFIPSRESTTPLEISRSRCHIVHYLPDWLPVSFKKIGNKGLALQKRMHFWAWEQTEKHWVRTFDSMVRNIQFLTLAVEGGHRRT